MNILGISAFYHDSAACLVRDGEIAAAAQEERFTRKKHDFSFPKNAIDYCLKSGGVQSADLDYVAFYDKPFIKFERILETYLAFAPLGIRTFIKAMPLWIKQKLWMKDVIAKELGFSGQILFPEHHESHAGSAFFPSPFEEAAFLTKLSEPLGSEVDLHHRPPPPINLWTHFSAGEPLSGIHLSPT